MAHVIETRSVATQNTSNKNMATNYYDSHGDYQADAEALEDPQLPLYAKQGSLPRLPVPTLEDTCQRFLPTALPLASTSNTSSNSNSNATQESLQQAVDQFPRQAKILQERLLQRYDENPNTSWLQHWWNTLGYLQVRDPIVVHVSYFFRCDDDPKLVEEQKKQTTTSSYRPCLARSAAMLPVAIQYAQTMRSHQSPPATLGKQAIPLCSAQYKYMFHACRIPRVHQDLYRMYVPSSHLQVAIAVRGQFFVVDLSQQQQQPLSQGQWRHILQDCIDQTTPSSGLPPSLGWLTGMGRDDWAQARSILWDEGGPLMQQALETLESSMFLWCMDIDDEIQTDRDRALQFWHGRPDSAGATTNGSSSSNERSGYHNRWYDKSASIIVTQNGKLGFQGEHSMLDGMPFVDFCDAMVRDGRVEDGCLDRENDSDDNHDDADLPKATNVFANAFAALSPQARSKIDACLVKARTDVLGLLDQYELDVQHYHAYGSNMMKKLAKCSPDAYIQMAMQLAAYRMFQEPQATYESTQVRPFLHGRTDTIRTVSPASLAFCQAMSDNDGNSKSETEENLRSHRYQLLQEACDSHVKYIRNAIKAEGVDRHFFGLSMLVQEGEEPPDLFSHPLYKKSKHFRLSTSSLPNMAVGFGPVVGDGLGIGYEAKPTSCIFHVTARKEHGWTAQVSKLLGEALDDMRDLYDLDDDSDKSVPRSRL